MAVVQNSYQFLEGKEETQQFRVQGDMLWDENDLVSDAEVLSSHFLITEAFKISNNLLSKGFGHEVIAAVVRADFRHLGITPLGSRVTVRTKVDSVAGNHITFSFDAYDEMEKIAAGEFERVILSKDYLMRKTESKMIKKL